MTSSQVSPTLPSCVTEFDSINDTGAGWSVTWVVREAANTVKVRGINVDRDLEAMTGDLPSRRWQRDLARVLWALVDEGEISRDAFPDSFLDVVLP